MILSFKNKNQTENDTDNTITSRSSSPLNRSDISSNILNLNFDGVKMKLYSSNCSIDLENKNLKEIFDESETSNIKLDNSNISKHKSRKEDFLTDIINRFNSPSRQNSSLYNSPRENTKDSLILNLDEPLEKREHRKNSLSCSDLNMLIKNFDMKTSLVPLKFNEKAKFKVHEFLTRDYECVSTDIKNSENLYSSEQNSLDNSFRKKKENFIPKAELFNRYENLENKKKNFKLREMNNQINPILNYYKLKLDLNNEKIEESNSNVSLNFDRNSKKKVSNTSNHINNVTINSNTTEELFSNLNNKIDNLDHTTFSYVTGNNVTLVNDNLNTKKILNQDYGINERNLNLERETENFNLLKQESSENLMIDEKADLLKNPRGNVNSHNFLNNLNIFGNQVTNEEDFNRKENLFTTNYFNIKIKNQNSINNVKSKVTERFSEENILLNQMNKLKDGRNLNPPHSIIFENNKNNVNPNLNSKNIYSESDYLNHPNLNNFKNYNLSKPNQIVLPNFNISSNYTADTINKNSYTIERVINRNNLENIFNPNTDHPISTNQNFYNPANQPGPILPNLDSPTVFNLGKSLNPNMNIPVINNIVINQNNINNFAHPTHVSNTNYLEYSDDQIVESAYFFAKDQCLCRHLQKKIMENPQMAKNIFISLKSKMLELINDPFGNYLVQKLVDNIEENKIAWIIDCITPTFLEVCSSSHGTRVIQKLIENLKTEILYNKFKIIFTQHLIEICKDVNANHIIHKFISIIKSPFNNFVYDKILFNIDEIARDKHGCCVVQKCLECSDPIQKETLVKIIQSNTLSYISDQYGNYVLQYLLSEDNYEVNRQIVQNILPNLIQLSVQKFSSNVIERSFDHADPDTILALVNEVATDEDIACKLMIDLYGNYVFQKALSIAKNENYLNLLKCVANNVDILKSAPFGPKLLTKLTIIYKELPIMIKNANRNQQDKKLKNKKNSNNKNIPQVGFKNQQTGMTNPYMNFFAPNKNFNSSNTINNNGTNFMNRNNEIINNNNYQNFGNSFLTNNSNNNYWNQNTPNFMSYDMNNIYTINNNYPRNEEKLNMNYKTTNSYSNTNSMPNRNLSQMTQPMAVNQYVNQVFYNMGNNNFIPNPNIMTTSHMHNNFRNLGKM